MFSYIQLSLYNLISNVHKSDDSYTVHAISLRTGHIVRTRDVKVMNNEITLAVSVDECATI